MLEALRSNQTLDLGGLGVGLGTLLLGLNLTADDELADLQAQLLELQTFILSRLTSRSDSIRCLEQE